jgi:hypothetical protein
MEERDVTTRIANPFARLEEMLADPPADGMFLTFVTPGSPAAEVGFRPGDIVVKVGDTPVTGSQEFYRGLQPAGEDDKSRPVTVLRSDGEEAEIEVPLPFRGYAACAVKKGKRAWEDLPDSDYEPDFSGLADGTEIWLRNSLEEERAGFERILIRHEGDEIHVDTLFRLGGEHEGETWDYRTHSLSRHRLNRWLSVTRTSFAEGAPGEEKLRGDMALGEDGVWRGRRGGPQGGEPEEVEFPSAAENLLTPYNVTLLPLTMPLAEGARVTFCGAGEGTALVSCRERMECVGKETVDVDGEEVEAWCFVWRHYGEYGESERFYVTDDRKLVRVDWGPNYGMCWAVNVPAAEVLDGVPEHVRLE